MTLSGQFLTAERQGHVIEVRLHRDPCNEIGTVALNELEHLVEHLKHTPCRAVIFYSDRPKGFCAGADLRELREGMLTARSSWLSKLSLIHI